jgi:hypothetical protein
MSQIAAHVFVLSLCMIASGDDGHRDPVPAVPLEKWLGPQTNDTATLFAPVVGPPIDAAKHEKLSRYDISVSVVPGRKLALPKSENPAVTFDGAEFQQIGALKPDQEALYVVGRVQLKKSKLGWRFYTLNVRVKAGPLEGAIVHLRDGRIQNSITDPCISVYRVPAHVDIKPGDLAVEPVAMFAK